MVDPRMILEKRDALRETEGWQISADLTRLLSTRRVFAGNRSELERVAGNWVSLDDGTGRGIVIFESEEAARAAAEQIKTNPPAGDAVTIDSIEVGEVVGHA